MAHAHTARPRSQASPAAALALDFGLRVRVDGNAPQRTLFSGAENLSLQELCSELASMVSQLRVRSFTLRHQLESRSRMLCSSTSAAASGSRLAAQRSISAIS